MQNIENLNVILDNLNKKKDSIKKEISEINKKTKQEVYKRKQTIDDLDTQIYVKELEIKVATLSSERIVDEI